MEAVRVQGDTLTASIRLLTHFGLEGRRLALFLSAILPGQIQPGDMTRRIDMTIL